MSLRILMVIHTPWSRDLGGPRAQMELGEELAARGDHVEKLSYEDVFPPAAPARPGSAGRILDFLRSNQSFAARAREYVRAHGHRFDVIDANQTDLPFPKRDLGFTGLLVARSVGLIPAYEEFERWARKRWPEPASPRELAWRALTWPGRRRRLRDVERSFRHADLINVSNLEDLETVSRSMGYGSKVVAFPFGLPEDRREAFRRARTSAGERLAACTVAFIGAWNSSKGSKDWPEIVRRVRERTPGARFLFLGTGLGPGHVLRDFSPGDREAVEVVPRYRSEDLPGLLARATVGAFPGYLEGFGFSVLEKVAAGLPTVTYDAPGPRETTRRLSRPIMVPPGDVAAFAERVSELLTLPVDRWTELSEDALAAAARLSWKEIAEETRAIYLQKLEEVRGRHS
ncbi:MAG TPA: glycosyltransferase [Thermoanaerobaculia bacterium]|nr:glycosyltransferase [Thermoanaerobaculia bacterium]